MTIGELAAELRRSVNGAAEGDRVLKTHLFGITRARELDGVSLKELVRLAKTPPSFHTEVRKGMRLADYVTLK